MMEEMGLEKKTYIVDETIRNVVIAAEEYNYQASLNHGNDPRRDDVLEKMAFRLAKHGLLAGLEQYVKAEIIDTYDGRAVRAKIWLPYVYDAKVASLSYRVNYLENEKRKLQDRINYLELPWHNKLLLHVKYYIGRWFK